MRANSIFGYLLLCVSLTTFSQVIREPHLAGLSYPDNADSLRFLISGYLKNHRLLSEIKDVKVIIVPHYPPAWDLTAYGFKQIEGCCPHTVVLISNYHYDTLRGKPFDGIAIDNADFWRTPFSAIPVNRMLADKLVHSNEKIIYKSSIFDNDWTIEPLLPFLQSVLNNSFEILPILFGNDLRIGGEINDNYRLLGNKLKRYLGPADIIIISNDMAHDFKGNYCSEASDQQILKIIEGGNYNALDALQKQYLDRAEMHGNVISCGIDGIKTGLAYFEKIGGGCINTIGYGNTDKDGFFVGYGTIMMVKYK